jgi:probable rRNA maturation factor
VAIELILQKVSSHPELPEEASLRDWANAACADLEGTPELVLRIVDEAESQALNREYRGKDRPTNVLSFPFEAPPGIPAELLDNSLGDLVICAQVVAREASEQGKRLDAHWAHILIHGILHLRGHDHLTESEAEAMESLEIELLAGLGFGNPYL